MICRNLLRDEAEKMHALLRSRSLVGIHDFFSSESPDAPHFRPVNYEIFHCFFEMTWFRLFYALKIDQ